MVHPSPHYFIVWIDSECRHLNLIQLELCSLMFSWCFKHNSSHAIIVFVKHLVSSKVISYSTLQTTVDVCVFSWTGELPKGCRQFLL